MVVDTEARIQLDKLRKTRPARAIDASGGQLVESNLRDQLIAALAFLRDDLKEECRLLKQARPKGHIAVIKDRTAVSGWLELFVVQLQRESDAPAPIAPSERLSPSAELGEHRPSEFGTPAAVEPGPGGRCAAGNVHDEYTLKCGCGYSSMQLDITGPASDVADYLSGKSDDLPTLAPEALTPTFSTSLADAAVPSDLSNIPGVSEWYTKLPDGSITIDAAAYIGDTLIAQVVGMDDGQAPAGIMSALGLNATEQEAHATVDKELAHVTAEPFVHGDPDLRIDPFAPIPTPAWTPSTPPGARKLTTLDLLQPVDAALLPPHLSFSQITTAADCGAKYRMQRVEQVPQVPQWANVGGKTFHAAVETIERSGMEERFTDRDAIENLWLTQFDAEIELTENESGMARSEFRASQQGKENYDWWRIEGAAMLQRYVDWRNGVGAGETLMVRPSLGGGNQPALEWELDYDVDGVWFKTILDSVWIDRSGANPVAVIRDWKTGTMTPDDRQLCTQAWGLRMAGCPWEVRVQFFDARKGTFSEPFNPFERMSWHDVRYFVLSGDADRRRPILSARPSDFCGGCSVAYACPVNTQRRAPKMAK